MKKEGQKLSEIEQNAIRAHWSQIVGREVRDDEIPKIVLACYEWVKARLESYPISMKLINDLQTEISQLQIQLGIAERALEIAEAGPYKTVELLAQLREAKAETERLDWLLARVVFVGLSVYGIEITDRADIDEARKSVIDKKF